MEGSRSRRDGVGETRDTRAAVDLRALEAELEAAMDGDLPADALRDRFLATLKSALARGDVYEIHGIGRRLERTDVFCGVEGIHLGHERGPEADQNHGPQACRASPHLAL